MLRTILLTALITSFLYSCKKAIERSSITLLPVQASLQAVMEEESFAKLDFTKVVYSRGDSSLFLRIGFLGERMAEHFVLLEMERGPRTAIAGGAIISLARAAGASIPTHFLKHSLSGSLLTQSTITGGYIDAYHPLTRPSSMMDPYKELPEVIVTASYSDVYNPIPVSPSEWYYLTALLQSGGGNGNTAYYGMADPPMGGGGGGAVPGGYTGGPSLPDADETMMAFEAEYVYSKLAIDIQKFFNCFDNIPSQGASYTVTISADVPSNNNPGASANYSAASAGHSFITVAKTNGQQKVTQSFGFYPKDMPSKTVTFEKIESELHDNGGDEINASLQISISESQFQILKLKAIELSSKKYELADYNCTHYALDVFNSVRSTPISVPAMTVYLPGTPGPYVPSNTGSVTINKSPQMLYFTLKEMKDKNSPEAAGIKLELSKDYRAPISKGACN